jgi:hypothetical protein
MNTQAKEFEALESVSKVKEVLLVATSLAAIAMLTAILVYADKIARSH